MYDDPVFQSGIKAQATSNARSPQTTVAEQSWLYDKTTPPIALKLSNSTLILVPFGLIVLWTIALVGFNLQRKRQRYSISKKPSPRSYHAVPCRSCSFFKNNPYLKCAIKPIDVLTAAAINCNDYAPQSVRQK